MRLRDGPVAQLDRALPSEGRGRRFESFRVRQYFQYLKQCFPPATWARGCAGVAVDPSRLLGRSAAAPRLQVAVEHLALPPPAIGRQEASAIGCGSAWTASRAAGAICVFRWIACVVSPILGGLSARAWHPPFRSCWQHCPEIVCEPFQQPLGLKGGRRVTL